MTTTETNPTPAAPPELADAGAPPELASAPGTSPQADPAHETPVIVSFKTMDEAEMGPPRITDGVYLCKVDTLRPLIGTEKDGALEGHTLKWVYVLRTAQVIPDGGDGIPEDVRLGQFSTWTSVSDYRTLKQCAGICKSILMALNDIVVDRKNDPVFRIANGKYNALPVEKKRPAYVDYTYADDTKETLQDTDQEYYEQYDGTLVKVLFKTNAKGYQETTLLAKSTPVSSVATGAKKPVQRKV